MFVVVLSYNGLADTQKCLTSLQPALRQACQACSSSTTVRRTARLTPSPQSSPGVRLFDLRGQSRARRREQRRNPAALELGAKWIMLLNNDTTVHPDLFDRLRMPPGASRISRPGTGHQVHERSGRRDDGWLSSSMSVATGASSCARKSRSASAPPRVIEVDIVNGCCLMIRG